MRPSPRTRDLFLLLKQWAIIAVGVAVASFLNGGIHYESFSSLFLAVIFISALNVFLKPLLVLFGLPFIVMTFGLGILLVNALIFSLAGYLVPGFSVTGFWPAFWGAFIVSVTTILVNVLLAKPKIIISKSVGPAPAAKGGAKVYRGKLDDVIDV